MVLQVNNLVGFGSGGSVPLSITHTDDVQDASIHLTYTFTGVSFGSPSSSRLIACTVGFRKTQTTIQSATIGGVSATLEDPATTSQECSQIIWAIVPNGTTGTIEIITADIFRSCALSVYRIVGQTQNTPADVAIATPGDIASPTIDFTSPPANGVAIYGFFSSNDNDGPGTWTNSIIEDIEETVGNRLRSSASFAIGTTPPDSAFERDSDPGEDTWRTPTLAGAAWK